MADLVVEQRGHVLWITLNRPEVRNALSRSLNLELGDVAENIIGREHIHAVVITGAGEVFCAGADLKERRGISARESEAYVSAISNAINAVGSIRRPTIAAMNGSAYGGGLELALACDFRILVDTADIALTEVRLGIMP
ncbi:MAG TPA: enoyl-CoA hydratase-related protein, partial [Kofleriaceae bacterium]|nr:enoyl-CoA hydratase-related protein [Kofleriaceae bacterium]